MKKALLFALTAALCSAHAQEAADAAFHRYDADRDGKVTPAELPQQAVFKRFDVNQDGHITLEETRSVMGGPTSSEGMPTDITQGRKLWQKLDKNKDGKLTSDEVPNPVIFAKFDLNKDGTITQDEGKKVVENTLKPSTPTNSPPEAQSVTTGPRTLKATDVGIGRQIPDIAFTDLAGATHKLSDFKAVVIAMTSSSCPVSKRYINSLAAFQEKAVTLILVNPLTSESTDEIKAQLAAAKITAIYTHDKKFAAALNAQTTTEVFLLDPKRTLIYRGALDDQYGINYNLDAPRAHYLRDAITAMRTAQQPVIAATAAPGCELDLTARNSPQTDITYHRDVARILQQNCVTCHRDNGIAPFALDNLAEINDRAKVIKRVISEGTMPPWFAAPIAEGKQNPWANDCSLSERDKADLIAWLDSSNRPLGNAADAPVKLAFADEWTIGKPDLIVQLPRPVSIKADGYMPYQFLTTETTLIEDKWVQGYEIIPTDRSVVHHVIVNVHSKGGGKIRDRGEGTSGYWAAYVPGNASQLYPEGFARKLPAGSTVSFQVHYTPSGKATQDQLRMGLIFAKNDPRYIVETIALPKRPLNIPPGEPNHLETTTRSIPTDLNVLAFMAHMHVRGKAFKYELITADKTETLLDIPRYDFNWQLRYDLATPRHIPAGAQLKITALFDNSAANKANPDPTKTVNWGPQTYDEMMIGYIETYKPLNAGAE